MDEIELSFASELPYERWWGIEILECTAEAVDMSRMNDGAGLLIGHRDSMHVGGVVPGSAVVRGDRKCACRVFFASDEEAQKYATRVADGVLQKVSVGYLILELVEENVNETGARVARTLSGDAVMGVMQRALEAPRGDREALYREIDAAAGPLTRGGMSTFRITRWQPFEVSLLPIPADPTVGVGRALEGARSTREFSTPAGRAGQHTTQESTMPEEVKAPAPAAPQPDIRVIENAAITAERQRAADIRALGQQTHQRELAEAAITSGESLAQFRERLVDRLVQAGSLTPAENPEIGMSARELQRFSFRKLFLAAGDPLNAQFQKDAAFEREVSEAARGKQGNRSKDREGGITIPVDVMNAPASAFGVEYARAQAAALIKRASDPAYRDLVVGTNTAGGHTVQTDVLGASFITLLRARSRLIEMGATLFTDLNGNLAIPRQTGGASVFWVAENGAPTESQATFDQVTLTPKTIAALTDYSRRLLLQSSIDIEAFVRTDLALGLGVGMDAAGVNGSGSSNQPLGILNQSGIGSVAGGTNGAAPTWDNIVDLEAQVANANADFGSLGYLTNSKVRSKLKRTQKFASTNGQEIWMAGRNPRQGIGELNGYDAYVSNNVPSNLDKGTSTGVCSAIAFGDFSAVLMGMWGGLDVLLDPYTGSSAGTKRVVALQDMDIAIRRAASFAAMKDALTT